MTSAERGLTVVTAAEICWTSGPADRMPAPSYALACEAIRATSDAVAAAVLEGLALSLVDAAGECQRLREVLRQALVLLHREQREARRLRDRLRDVLDVRRAQAREAQ